MGVAEIRGPFVGTSAIVVRDGAVLLGMRKGAHGAGEWSFPGGEVDPGEAPEDTAARELAEETGLRAADITSTS
ncbi:NUDIX domain-containing protein [Saccharopolyspora aridisoli]|uniref:NUDIX domain-containing protein n=1 Tax=Saccharopolyspora aridisoli TaxID=2530385 RepID=UPI001F19FD1F|nr:NUDIX domain-containing protein [Saccharopolyspora aridisoli]